MVSIAELHYSFHKMMGRCKITEKFIKRHKICCMHEEIQELATWHRYIHLAINVWKDMPLSNINACKRIYTVELKYYRSSPVLTY